MKVPEGRLQRKIVRYDVNEAFHVEIYTKFSSFFREWRRKKIQQITYDQIRKLIFQAAVQGEIKKILRILPFPLLFFFVMAEVALRLEIGRK